MKKNKLPKIVVITGGSSGIGLELVKKFTAGGDRVYMLARTNPENFERFTACDVGDEATVRDAFAAIAAAEGGKIDILVNNAGVGIEGATELLDTADVRRCVDVNFVGVFLCCKYALPHMGRGAKIINISSANAFFARPFHAVYGAVKAAVSHLSHCLRMELAIARTGIQVTAICPKGIATAFAANRIAAHETNERYAASIASASAVTKNSRRIPAPRAAAKIHAISRRRNLKPTYIIGGGYKILYLLTKVFPLRFVLWVTIRVCRGKK